jgi:phage tail P2-like protein
MGASLSDSLLPIGSTPLEIAAEAATTAPVAVPNGTLWNPRLCPTALLPWLAHSLSVDSWDPAWPEETKRRVIATSVEVHRRKGTRASVRVALEAAGYGQSRIVEGSDPPTHDGSFTHDGVRNHSGAASWAEYSVFMTRPVTLEQAAEIRRLLVRVAPTRCRLRSLRFSQAGHLHDGKIRHDGVYSHGAA